MYTHYTRDERAIIALGVRLGRSYKNIGDEIGRNKSSICREVNKNKDIDGVYRVWSADKKAKIRRAHSKKNERLIETHQRIADEVEALLDPLVSPEVIAFLCDIHHQTIYSWIYRSRPDLKKRLPREGKKRRKYGSRRGKKQGWTRLVRSIEEREERQENWEGDTIRGKGKARLLTHVERSSLFTRVDQIPDGTADVVQETLNASPLSGTITYDRGSEFALWKMIEEEIDATIYFACPHHPWQRGKNENTNERLRRVYPKKTDFSRISKKDIKETVDLMNHTPRKSLGWRTPTEVYNDRCTSE